MSSTCSQSNEATANAPTFVNLELFQANSDVEKEEDLEKIQCKVNDKIVAARIHNEKILQKRKTRS